MPFDTTLLQLLLLVSLHGSLHQCAAMEYWVKPTHPSGSSTCPEPCHSLSEYLQDTAAYFTSNTTFHFLPGTHTLDQQNASIVVRNISNLSFIRWKYKSTNSDYPLIQCEKRLGFVFSDITYVHISEIGFINCGFIIPSHLLGETRIVPQTPPKVQAALTFIRISKLDLEQVAVNESYGFGLLAYNLLGNASVKNCAFYCNNIQEVSTAVPFSSCQSQYNSSGLGGNAAFLFIEDTKHENTNTSFLEIFNTMFGFGTNTDTGNEFWSLPRLCYYWRSRTHDTITCDTIKSAGGLTIVAASTPSFIRVHIHSCTFHDNFGTTGANLLLHYNGDSEYYTLKESGFDVSITNSAIYNGKAQEIGGGLYVQISGPYSRKFVFIKISSSVFYNNRANNGSGILLQLENGVELIVENCAFVNNEGEYGSAMYMALPQRTHYDTDSTTVTAVRVHIYNSLFKANFASIQGGGIYVRACVTANDFVAIEQHIDIVKSIFTKNSAQGPGSAISFVSSNGLHLLKLTVDIIDSTFVQNSNPNKLLCCTVLYLHQVQFPFTLTNSSFVENSCSGISTYGSTLHFQGNLTFSNNHGCSGGAVFLECSHISEQSHLFLDQHTRVYMMNNSAKEYGGAIAADEKCNTRFCCLQVTPLVDNDVIIPDVQIVMENNTAGIAGDSLYSSSLEQCILKSSDNLSFQILSKFLSEFLVILDINRTTTAVASTAYKLCFCDLESKCKTSDPETNIILKEAYQGQLFHVAVMSLGHYPGASPSIVQARIDPSTAAELGERQDVQKVGRSCENLTFSVRSTEKYVDIIISVEGNLNRNIPAIVSITLLTCPIGFEFSDDPPMCDCAKYLRKPGVNCDIDKEAVHRPASMWIGNFSGDVVIHSNCPFDYCKPEDNDISLYAQDEQCALNRSGILCGACQQGLSLALGTSQCMHCSNAWLSLTLPFALAGVVLVLLLLKCNLTVSTGTINGLIFYANIIAVNSSTFFPPGKTNLMVHVLSVFIAWLNLDLGIQTCFFNGMDAYTKTWLQFVFPVYIWILVGFLVYVSKHSTTFSHLTGTNIVSVLATLFLLSYAKLLRTIIATVSFTTLTGRHGNTPEVWLPDGNVHFMQWPHALIFLAGLLAAIGYVLPFTMLMLFAPLLQKSNHRLLRWVHKLKPLLDSYQDPYKDKYRWWTGLMLVVRIILFAIFAGNALGDPRVNLLMITITAFLLLTLWLLVGKIYKNVFISILEWFFLLNLGIFAAVTLFIRTSEGVSTKQQTALACTMVGSAFVVFCGILLYHSYQELRKIENVFQPMAVCIRKHSTLVQRIFKMKHDEPEQPLSNIDDNSTALEQPSQTPTASVIRMSELREPLLTNN